MLFVTRQVGWVRVVPLAGYDRDRSSGFEDNEVDVVGAAVAVLA